MLDSDISSIMKRSQPLLLKRLQAIGRAEKDEELIGWVRAVAHALPVEAPRPPET